MMTHHDPVIVDDDDVFTVDVEAIRDCLTRVESTAIERTRARNWARQCREAARLLNRLAGRLEAR